MTDYECGMRKALAEIYPDAKLVSCWFHYCQAIRRKCSKFGNFFATLQKDKPSEKLFLKFLALPLLPADQIRETFNMLKLTANAMDDKGKLFTPMLKYYEKQWLQRVSFFFMKVNIYLAYALRNSNGNQINFAFYLQENENTISVDKLSMRETSSLKSYNSRLAQKLPSKGNFYKFMKSIAEEELVQSHDMALLVESGGGAVARMERKRKFKDKDALIKEATDSLANGKITTMEFLRLVTYDASGIIDGSMANYTTPKNYESDNHNAHFSGDENYDDVDDNSNDPSLTAASIAAAAVAEEQLCAVCKDKKRDALFLPCKDLKMCEDCASQLRASFPEGTPMKCPFCKAIVLDVIHGIYL